MRNENLLENYWVVKALWKRILNLHPLNLSNLSTSLLHLPHHPVLRNQSRMSLSRFSNLADVG